MVHPAMCAACGFRHDGWGRRDTARTAAALPAWWELALAGVPLGTVAEASEQASLASAERAAALVEAGQLERAVLALHDALHPLHLAGRTVADAGRGAPPHEGAVVQLNVSDGGVPKHAVAAAAAAVAVGWRGLAGDRQAERAHHGRPWQALCLWSADVVDRLAGEGHPITYGAAGENVTIRGVDWASLRPGTRLALGGVTAEVSLPAVPCRKNAQWFVRGDYRRMALEREPGVTRWYAWVRGPGDLAVGDRVVVEP